MIYTLNLASDFHFCVSPQNLAWTQYSVFDLDLLSDFFHSYLGILATAGIGRASVLEAEDFHQGSLLVGPPLTYH